jgi:hypothetical protein
LAGDKRNFGLENLPEPVEDLVTDTRTGVVNRGDMRHGRSKTRLPGPRRATWCLVGLCFFLLFAIPDHTYLHATGTAHDAKGRFLAEALSWIRIMEQKLGLSSLELEIHGVSLQVSEMLAHLGQFLPPAVRDWKPSGEIVFDLVIGATTGQGSGDTIVTLHLHLSNLAFSSPDATKRGEQIDGEIQVNLAIPGASAQPATIETQVALEAGEIAFGNFRFDLETDPLRLNVLGAYDLQRDRLSLLSVDVHVPTVGQGTITATLEPLKDPSGEVRIALGPISNQRVFEIFVKGPAGPRGPVMKNLSVTGETSINASIRGSLHRWSIEGLIETSAIDLRIPAQEIGAKGVQIRLPFAMEFPQGRRSAPDADLKPSIAGLIRAERIMWRSRQWENVAVPVAFAGNTLLLGQTKLPVLGGTIGLEEGRIANPLGKTMDCTLVLRADQLDLSQMARGFSPSPKPFLFSGLLNGKFSGIRVLSDTVVAHGDVTLHALGGQIKVRNIHARIPFSGLPEIDTDVIVESIHLEDASLGPYLPPGLVNWKWSGVLALDLTAGPSSPYGRRLAFGAKFAKGTFSSPDDTRLGENVQGEIHVEVHIPGQQSKRIEFQGDLTLKGGEILLESFYLDLEQDPFRLRSEGVYDPTGHGLPSLSVRLDAPTIGQGAVTATLKTLDDPEGEIRLAIGPISNERAFQLFLKEPFGQVWPMLKGLSLNGQAFVTAAIHGSRDRWSMQGLVKASAMNLAIPTHQIKARGVKIQLPFSFSHPEEERAPSGGDPEGSVSGSLQADRIQWGSQEWQDLMVPLTLRKNALLLPPRLELPLWGGALILEGARIQDPFEKTLEITLGLRLDQLDVSKIIQAFAPFSLSGTLEGNFPEIKISQDRLSTQGTLTVHAFGGRIDVSNIQGKTPFSRLRKVSMAVRLRDINLEEASRSLQFGQMGGMIHGQIRDLTFCLGQPERFELEIWSVKKRGVRQYVNAEAVNNLSILSTGSALSLSKGFLRFFEYYPYAKLGIYCKLEHDLFTLRGTIHQKGVEYLIRKGGIRGIDVINQNPENRIRWRQMLGRLKAIHQGKGDVRLSTQE